MRCFYTATLCDCRNDCRPHNLTWAERRMTPLKSWRLNFNWNLEQSLHTGLWGFYPFIQSSNRWHRPTTLHVECVWGCESIVSGCHFFKVLSEGSDIVSDLRSETWLRLRLGQEGEECSLLPRVLTSRVVQTCLLLHHWSVTPDQHGGG